MPTVFLEISYDHNPPKTCFLTDFGINFARVMYLFTDFAPFLCIPLSRPADSVVSQNRLYTGDMVNAVLNTTAGGLQGAFWSGKAAGEAIAAGDISKYQATWDSEIKPWLMKHHVLHRRIHKNGAKSVNRYITLAKLMPKSVKKQVFGGL